MIIYFREIMIYMFIKYVKGYLQNVLIYMLKHIDYIYIYINTEVTQYTEGCFWVREIILIIPESSKKPRKYQVEE